MKLDNLLATDDNLQAATREAELAKYTVGNVVTFGKYEQDNNTANGKEDVEWIVLDRQGNKALLISKDALDCNAYNDAGYPARRRSATWESCTLREWLNGSFLTTVFSTTEED